MPEAAKSKSAFKKALDIAYYILIGLIIILAIAYTFFTFSTKDGVTSVFGYVITSVQSDSMSGTFERGDVIIIKEFDVSAAAIGDIICFYFIEPQSGVKITVTHRIIGFEGSKIITQGDVANRNNSVDQTETVSRGDVIGKYNGTKIPGFGKVTDFLKTSTGFFCCVLVPVLLFLFWQIYVFIKTLTEAKSLGKQKQINDQARQLAEQMLAEMEKQKQAADSKAEEEPKE